MSPSTPPANQPLHARFNPLIQDVTFIEGPILRHFHLSTLKFVTAGQLAARRGIERRMDEIIALLKERK